jgi:hypothetical protein
VTYRAKTQGNIYYSRIDLHVGFSVLSLNSCTATAHILFDHAHGFMALVQGLGKRPAGILVGTWDGRFCHVKHGAKPQPFRWYTEDRPRPRAAVHCMAATDQFVVTGSCDGALRILRMADVAQRA